MDARRQSAKGQRPRELENVQVASIEKLDEYIESMYSDVREEKLYAARALLFLSQFPEYLEHLPSHYSLFGVLARTMRDEYRTDMELSIYISTIFYIYSSYSDFHQFLLQNQVGDTCMKTIEYHIKRYDVRVEEFKKMAAKSTPDVVEEEQVKMQILEKKQNKLLWLCFTILLNIAEDLQIERKMKRRGIIELLVKMLERDNLALLTTVMLFLKKMSVFKENKDEMFQEEFVVKQLKRYVPCPHHQELSHLVLRLVHNLCFDQQIRLELDQEGFIPKLVDLLKEASFRGITIRILYQLSLEDKCKSTFTYTECIPMIYMLVVQFPGPKVGKELIGLGINLVCNPRNAEIFADGEQLSNLMKRALKFQDPLLMKLVRNICYSLKTMHVQETLAQYCIEIINQMINAEESDFMVELLGTLVHLDAEKGWVALMQQTDILAFLNSQLEPGFAEDDVILECIMLLATMISHRRSAKIISESPVLRKLSNLLSEKQEDDEIVNQMMYAVYKMMMYRHTRDFVLQKTNIIAYVLQLLEDANARIRKMADQLLMMVQEFSEEYREAIKQKRFTLHNLEWITEIQNMEAEEDEEYESEEESDSQFMWEDADDLADRVWDYDSDEY